MVEPVIEIEPGDRPNNGSRRSAFAIGTAVALALGVVGFAGGRLSAPDHSRTASGADTAQPATSSVPAEATAATDAPAILVPDTASPITEAPAETTIVGSESSDSAMASTASGGGASGIGGQYSAGAYEEPAMDLISERTTADGIVIRAHRSRADEGMYPYEPWPEAEFGDWKPASWCFPTGNLRLSIVSVDAVNLGWAPWYSEPKDGVSVSTFAAGYVESNPVFAMAVQVAPGATGVTVTTADGRTDTAAPSGDVALLAVAGPIAEDFTVTVQRPDGDTSVTAEQLTETWSSVSYREACEPPPPALPPAGEQPADPDAARTAIDQSWQVARSFGDTTQTDRLAFVDDPTGVAEAWQAIQDGDYADAANSSTSTIRELVFTSPTEAWVRYDIASSVTNFPNRYGIVRLGDDGVWRVTRATICQDIMLVPDGACEPGVELVLPPSAESDPRFNPHFYDDYVSEGGPDTMAPAVEAATTVVAPNG